MKKTFLAFALALVMAFGVFGCADRNADGPRELTAASGGTSVIETQEYSVWSAPSTVKIRKEDTAFADKGGAELRYQAVRGEYESRQLMITAKSDIPSYELTVSALENGKGDSIGTEHIDVYNEFYTEILTPTTADLRPGFYPDALIPIELAKSAGELKIEQNCNQGLWITICVPEEIDAGKYEGSFKLKVGSDSYDIPVSVDVYDFTLPVTRHTDTLFILRDVHLMASELDSTLEMKETYYEFFLDYRINLNNLPIDSLDPDDYVETVKKYYDDERVTRYTVPSNVTGETSVVNVPLWKELYLAVAAASTPEKDLTSKLMFYFIDEPEGTTGVPAALVTLGSFHTMLGEIVEEIESDTTGKYDAFKEIEGWKKNIEDTRNVATLEFGSEELLQNVTVWCPSFYTVSKSTDRNYAIEKAEELGAELWWYGCGGPTYPYPTYHVDDNLLSSRVISWMQQAYGFTGQLYWSVASATDVYESAYYGEEVGNPYNFSRGDGYLVYPGARYGHYGPLPSLRLMSIRDGLEEYDMLCELQEKYEDLSEQYGFEMDAQKSVNRIYERIYNGMIPTTDIDLFAAARAELLAALAETDTAHGFLIGSVSIVNNVADITMYVKDGYGIRIGDEVLTEQNGAYRYSLDLTESTYLNAVIFSESDVSETYSVNKFISGVTKELCNFDDESSLEYIEVTEGSLAELHDGTQGFATAGNSVRLSIVSRFTGNEFEDARFRPSFTIDTKSLLESTDFTSANTLNFDVYNAGDFAFDMKVTLYSGRNSYVLDDVTVPVSAAGTRISLNLASVQWSGLSDVTAVTVQMTNGGTAADPVIYEMFIDNLFVDMKG